MYASLDHAPLVKFCGLRRLHEVRVAAKLGVDFIGLMFVEKSPRYIAPNEALALNREIHKHGMLSVGVFMNPSIETLVATITDIPLDFIQLHGQETKAYCREVLSVLTCFNCGVIKACGVSSQHDLEAARDYENACSFLLLDTLPPKDSLISGGHGARFNWNILSSFHPEKPYFLAGGINANNVFQIPQPQSMLLALDVSSGIEYPKFSQYAYRKSVFRMQQLVKKIKKVYHKR